MRYRIRDFSLTNVIAILAACITIYSASGLPDLEDIFNTQSAVASTPSTFGLAGLLLLALSWGILGWREFVYSRKARYSEATGPFREALEHLKEADYAATKRDIGHAKRALGESAMALSTAFSLVASVHCRVCIKDLYYDTDVGESVDDKRRFKVSTTCRSDAHRNKRDEDDWLSDNSDFLELFEDPNKPWFIHNNLPKLEGYRNSHWPPEVYKTKSFEYRSTIVWPIRSCVSQEGDAAGMENLVGFLCVDAKPSNVFEERYDTELGASFASALYPTIMKIRTVS